MAELYSNNANTTIVGAINNSVTSVTLTSATGFPGSGTYAAMIYVNTAGVFSNVEIVTVTAMAGAVATITRGQEGTTAVSHAAGESFSALFTDRSLRAGMDERVATHAAVVNAHTTFGNPTAIGTANAAGTSVNHPRADHVHAGLGLPQGLTGALSPTRYVGGTASVAPTTGTFAVGDFVITQAGTIYICTVAGSPGTWVAVTGGGGADLTAAFAFSGDITPTTLAANTNDYAPTGLSTASTLRISASAAYDLTGITGGSDGRILILQNVGAFAITCKDNVTSTAANRFEFGADITIAANQSLAVWYDGTSSRWRALDDHGISHLADHSDINHTGPNKVAIYLRSVLVATETALDFKDGVEVVNTAGVKNQIRPPAYNVILNGAAGFGTTPTLGGNTRAAPDDAASMIRTRAYLGAFTKVRFQAAIQTRFSTAGGAGVCTIFPQWSLDNATWSAFESSGTGLDADASVTATYRDSGFLTMTGSAAVANGTDAGGENIGVYIRVAFYGSGTGAAGTLRNCVLSFR